MRCSFLFVDLIMDEMVITPEVQIQEAAGVLGLITTQIEELMDASVL